MTDLKEQSSRPASQPAPDELNAENTLICEKLLGWKQSSIKGYWYPNDEHAGSVTTPTFHSWYHAGLILEAFERAKIEWDIHTAMVDGFSAQVVVWPARRRIPTDWLDTGPLAIRAAALEYIRSLP